MDVLFTVVTGFAVAFIALMFMYRNMNPWQRQVFEKRSLLVELVFFFAPFALSFLSNSTDTMLISLGFGLGLSTFSASIKKQIDNANKTKRKKFRKWLDKMSNKELKEYVDRL